MATFQAPASIPRKRWIEVIDHEGVLAVLNVLQQLEKDEFYEECARVLTAVKSVSKRDNYEYPKRLNKEAVFWMVEAWRDHKKVKSFEWVEREYRRRGEEVLLSMGYQKVKVSLNSVESE